MIVRRALDVLQVRAGVDTERTGLFGSSIGGMWALQAVADQRVKALYDLRTDQYEGLPAPALYTLKTKMCQVIGARDTHAIAEVLGKNSTESDAILSKVTCPSAWRTGRATASSASPTRNGCAID